MVDEKARWNASLCVVCHVQTYFKKSLLTVLNDCPMASHGRVRRLLVPDSVEVKQRRQRWDADLAKAAISCPTIDTYRLKIFLNRRNEIHLNNNLFMSKFIRQSPVRQFFNLFLCNLLTYLRHACP